MHDLSECYKNKAASQRVLEDALLHEGLMCIQTGF